MKKDTEKVLEILSGTKSITEFLEANKDAFELLTIGEYLELEIKSKNDTKASVIKKAGSINDSSTIYYQAKKHPIEDT